MSDKVISIENLVKTYKTYKRGSSFSETVKSFFKREYISINAVNDVSFSAKKGQVIGVLGPNGAGKSTLIKMMTGTLFPTSGKVEVMGLNPTKNRTSYVNKIGAVFGQKSQLIWDIPPIDSFAMNRAIYDVPKPFYQERLDSMCSLFEINEVIHKPTRVLSLGERMKCEFIMAMLHNPDIVFLDEPTIGLDVIAKQKIREFIKQKNNEGVSFVLTTHDLEDVEQLAHSAVIINHGEKVFDGSLKTLRHTLGEKKIITLMLSSPIKGLELEGVKILEQPNDLEITLEADTEIIPIDILIQKLSEYCSFTDISIKELPMETIITKIYQN